MRLPFLRAVIACALGAALSAGFACTRVGTSENGSVHGNAQTVHGVVRLAIIGEPNTLNPIVSGLVQEGYMESAIFDGLLMLDNFGEVTPDLATAVPSLGNGGISRDGKTIIYHLRHGVRWQDGAPFTSADVAFTYRAYINPKVNTFYGAIYQHIASLSTPDAYTVVLHLRQPFAPALINFFLRGTGGYVIPRHLLEMSRDLDTDPFGKNPVGTGPFLIARWEHGSTIVLKANPNYFAGAPKVEEVDVRIVVNPNTQLEMVQSHELDVAAQLVPAQYAQIQHLAGVRAVLARSLLERFLTFNLRRPPLDDPRVRRALALALDRPLIVQTAYNGTSQLAQTLIAPWSWAYDPAGAPPYDPGLARSLLDRAGWFTGVGGMRSKNGRPLSLVLVNQTEVTALSIMAQEIQRAWHDVGVETTIRAVPRNVIYGSPGIATQGTFDVLMDDWAADTDPDRGLLIETKNVVPRGWNDAYYSNADVDRWSHEAAMTYDLISRKALYSKIQRQLNGDLPFLPLAWEGRIYAVNTDLRNFIPEPIYSDFWNAQKWQI